MNQPTANSTHLQNVVNHLSSRFRETMLSSEASSLNPHSTYQNLNDFVLNEDMQHLSSEVQSRVRDEFTDCGPLKNHLSTPHMTEIMICGKNEIWIEDTQGIRKIEDHFISDLTYTNFIHKIYAEAGIQTNYEFPFANGEWRGFRIHLSSPPVTKEHVLTLRKLNSKAYTMNELCTMQWCREDQKNLLLDIVKKKKNILVVGNTGSGKTTLINALLQEASGDRCLFIEDTPELILPNPLSVRLLTRFDAQGKLPEIDQSQLVKQSLRMRPDRLIIGEVRSHEAKDLLMALSTGHRGSMTSLHANNPQEALLRLEMLIQMAAPQWSLDAIRRLMKLTIDIIVITRKEQSRWFCEGVYKISSLEPFGFTIAKTEIC